MCSLLDIRYCEKHDDVFYTWEIDADGCPLYLIGTLTRPEARNIERHVWAFLDETLGFAPYECACHDRFLSWEAVVSHCDMYLCRTCRKATNQWDGWDYQCRVCDGRS